MVLDDPKLVRLVAGITGGIEAPAQFILQVTIVIHLQINKMSKYYGFLWIEHFRFDKQNAFTS